MTQKWILSITLATFFLSHLPYSYAASWIDTDQWEQEQIDQSKDLKALFEPNPLRNEFDKAEEASYLYYQGKKSRRQKSF